MVGCVISSVEPLGFPTIVITNYFFRIFVIYFYPLCLSSSEILINSKTNSVWRAGDKYQRLKLAETLELIRDSGASVLYNGTLTAGFVKDIQDLGGIITEEDMNEYQ
jgi:hypothetical protein